MTYNLLHTMLKLNYLPLTAYFDYIAYNYMLENFLHFDRSGQIRNELNLIRTSNRHQPLALLNIAKIEPASFFVTVDWAGDRRRTKSYIPLGISYHQLNHSLLPFERLRGYILCSQIFGLKHVPLFGKFRSPDLKIDDAWG